MTTWAHLLGGKINNMTNTTSVGCSPFSCQQIRLINFVSLSFATISMIGSFCVLCSYLKIKALRNSFAFKLVTLMAFCDFFGGGTYYYFTLFFDNFIIKTFHKHVVGLGNIIFRPSEGLVKHICQEFVLSLF